MARTLRSLLSSVGLTLAVVALAGCASDTHKTVVAPQPQVNAGITPSDVIAMTKAGLDEELIVNNIRAHGMVAPLQPQDLIALQQQGISARVIATMQACPPQVPQPQAVVVGQPAPPQVVVGVDPYWGPRYYPRRCYW
jgi:uncharacterized lipoprotein YajG